MKKTSLLIVACALAAAWNCDSGFAPRQAVAQVSAAAFDEDAVLNALFALESKGQAQKQDQRQGQRQAQKQDQRQDQRQAQKQDQGQSLKALVF